MYDLIVRFTSWIWGIPILIVLIGGGIILTLIINGIQFTKPGFIIRNTIGKKEDKPLEDGEISPLQGMVAALAATVGTGNIVGVGVAIAMGGPGAMF